MPMPLPASPSLARRIRKLLLVVAFLLLACYASICAYMYAHQHALMYLPQATHVAVAETDFSLPRDGATLRGWMVNPGKPRAILYFGGNAEAIQDNRAHFARWFPERSVYLLAYRGYGASDGQPEEASLFADALALYDHVHKAHPEMPIDVLGRSLGTGVASYLASKRPLSRLALVTPFDSMVAVAQERYPWLPVHALVKDRYESDHYLAQFHGKVLVIRAGRDQVVSWARTQVLIDALPQPPRVLEIPDAGHGSVRDFPVYAQALRDFFRAGALSAENADATNAPMP